MNYTKYVLKNNEEICQLLNGIDNLFVVSCNKCFKEFESVCETDSAEFEKLAREQGKNIIGSVSVDFLCNAVQTERKLKDVVPSNAENVIVLSCGLGVQTTAELLDMPVLTATDSLNYIGHHGMALTKKTCEACNQCFLNTSGGICPITDCTKSLLNGPCGGTKNGKCEIDPKKDCAWEKIYCRLKEQGRLEEFINQPIQLRDYSKLNFKAVNEYVKSVREKRFEGFYGGIHPFERKEATEHIAIKEFPCPKTVVIPTLMHSGTAATPLVNVGDYVKLGQKIAQAEGMFSCNVHSSVSGIVSEIKPVMHPIKSEEILSITIESDEKFLIDETVKPSKPLDELSAEEIVNIVYDKGIAGMGGSGFPTHIKLNPNKPIETVILNGSECEPVITADHRVMLEYADDVILGLKAIIKAVGAKNGVIVIEDNKPDAIELLSAKLEGEANLSVCAARTKYPQGAEKMMIKRVMDRMVPSGKLPADVGAVVSNVSTAKAIADAINTGMPLVKRVVTVSGEYIKNPGNFMVSLGTPASALIDHCGGVTKPGCEIKMGGVMMGTLLEDTNTPIMKNSNGIIAIATDVLDEQPCIKCGRCVDVCPMQLMPLYFSKYQDEANLQGLADKNIMDCMECGCCQYICSSKIQLVAKIKAAKKAVRGMK